MTVQNYSQTTFETCLSVCLLQLSENKIDKKAELETLYYALNFSKENFTIGHLEYRAKKYKQGMDLYVDNNWFLRHMKNIQFSPKIYVSQ
ncbi:MAG: hypothetical protein V1848_02005, partial [Candidatus Magasanikbacteria bacterium]